jgi:hypothetical protein
MNKNEMFKIRLNELSLLPDNWYHNSEGKSLDKNDLLWFENCFLTNYDNNLIFPCVFPTLNGGLNLEWNDNDISISVEVYLTDKNCEYYLINHSTKECKIIELDLTKEESWNFINNEILNYERI